MITIHIYQRRHRACQGALYVSKIVFDYDAIECVIGRRVAEHGGIIGNVQSMSLLLNCTSVYTYQAENGQLCMPYVNIYIHNFAQNTTLIC